MCKGCVASALTIDILRFQLDREKARADKFEALALSLAGLTNETPDESETDFKPIPGKVNWNVLRRKLEAADRKKLNDLTKNAVPEGQEV
jgi:hypothetical protein